VWALEFGIRDSRDSVKDLKSAGSSGIGSLAIPKRTLSSKDFKIFLAGGELPTGSLRFGHQLWERFLSSSVCGKIKVRFDKPDDPLPFLSDELRLQAGARKSEAPAPLASLGIGKRFPKTPSNF